MAELPSGAVTFLFTDVEGSTRLLKQLRDRYGEVLAEHQRLLREAFEPHGGRVVDTQGDSFFVAFGSARGAVLAAVEAQRALAAHGWPEGGEVRVRMGIHTGQAAASEQSYLGLAVHRAARISAAGHGGQVLISQTTHNLLEDEEEDIPGVTLRDLGEQRLKDLDRTVRLYQVKSEGLRRDFPPLRTEAPAPAAAPAPRFSRRRTILAGALAGVIAAAVAIPIFALGGGRPTGAGLGAAGGNAVGVIGSASGVLEGAIDTPGAPSAVAVGLGSVWAASADSNAVYAIDPGTNTVRDTITVETAPGGIAVGAGSVWVTNSLAGTVSQVSPQFGVLETVPVGNGPAGVAVGGGHVWVANTTDHTVSKIRASDSRHVGDFAAGPDPSGIAVGAGAVWVASKSSGLVVKLSQGGDVLREVHVGEGPEAVAVGGGAVWVANSLSGTVSKIDPVSGNEIATIEVGEGPSGIAVAGGNVWTANELAGTVSRIDPSTNRATEIRVGGQPTAVAAGSGVVYVALRPTGASHRGGTLTIVLPTRDPITTLDPATAYSSLLSLTNDGLLTYRRVGGQAGYQLVSDLARSMPTVSEDGKAYTFELRPNIGYSNGRVVRASDFRYAIERAFTIRPRPEPGITDSFRAIRGADRCGRERCDLSDGIVTDDAARTVTFHLSAPDAVFLYKLASTSAAVVPVGTSLHEAKRRPLPATGPYQIASFTPNRSVRLVRNPRFREWSRAAQPAGFPDEIVVKIVADQKTAVALVQQGKADLTSGTPEQPFRVPPTFRPQLHTYPTTATFYLAVNPNKPPFDDIRARQALNYALDRNRVVQLVGEETARPTCQVLPPNFPGYRRYCPYTLDPTSEGSWSAPDLAKARRLVAESGTAGTPVTLWFTREGGPRLGRYLGALIGSLGYHARVRSSFKNLDAYFASFTKRGARPQILWAGWIPDYPAASNYIEFLFSCSSESNYGHFCDRALDRKIERALEVQQDDPVGANRLWAALDREITDKAAWVPLYNLYGTDFVSKRVGNYQYNPQWGALLSQMWVR